MKLRRMHNEGSVSDANETRFDRINSRNAPLKPGTSKSTVTVNQLAAQRELQVATMKHTIVFFLSLMLAPLVLAEGFYRSCSVRLPFSEARKCYFRKIPLLLILTYGPPLTPPRTSELDTQQSIPSFTQNAGATPPGLVQTSNATPSTTFTAVSQTTMAT